MASRSIVVAGALANKYGNGGEAWVRLTWVRGFQRLGFDVHFIEQLEPTSCLDESGSIASFHDCAQLRYFQAVVKQFGLHDRATLVTTDGKETSGKSLADLTDVLASAMLLVNISGHLEIPTLFTMAKRKAYVDIDPGFTQFWHHDGIGGSRLHGHDIFFTIAENIGQPDCPIPCDVRWITTRQPVILGDWPFSERMPQVIRFTTIANWRGPFGAVTHTGKTFGLKLHEFRKFLSLPANSPHTFEIALNIHPAEGKDRASLEQNGWQLTDPHQAADPERFRRYVQQSDAEFSVAQGIYVDTNSGWFSDRSIRYLASGRPALVQDTGFSRYLPVGLGLIPFRTLEQARAGVESIAADYIAHSCAARRLAETHFSSDLVLSKFLDDAGV